MTRLEDDLRAAMRATAQKIPPGPPPPLTLPKRRRLIRPLSPGYWSRRSWAFALATVFLIGAVVAASLALGSVFTEHRSPVSGPFPPQPLHVPDVPAYYVALTSADGKIPGFSAKATIATIRATATGKVLATIAVPRPYHAFTGVTAAADDHTFVLVASEAGDPQRSLAPPARYYVLHFDPASPAAAGRVRLQALPATWIPAGSMALAMALSANGTSLAAIIGTSRSSKLYVYQLPKGSPHVWSWSACSNCSGDGIGPDSVGPYPGALSWVADGRTVAFLFFFGGAPGIGVRLLDTHATGTNLLADSKLAVPMADVSSPVWRRVIITPDGRTVFAVLENEPYGQHFNQQLVKFSVATGKQAAVLNQPPIGNHYEQIQWASPTGGTLLISGAQHGGGAGVLKDGRYTPIPWSNKIFAAAW
jgi:hypothetical protein